MSLRLWILLGVCAVVALVPAYWAVADIHWALLDDRAAPSMWVPIGHSDQSLLLGALSWSVAVFSAGFAALAASTRDDARHISFVCLVITLLFLPASYWVLMRRGTCGADWELLENTNCAPDTVWP